MSTDSRPASAAGAQAPTANTEPQVLPSLRPNRGPNGTAPAPRSNLKRNIVLLVAAVLVFDIAAAILVPPFPKGEPGKPISGIGDLILANLEIPPAPEVVWPAPAPQQGPTAPLPIVGFSVSISNSLFTMQLVCGRRCC